MFEMDVRQAGLNYLRKYNFKTTVFILALTVCNGIAQNIGLYMQNGYHNNQFSTKTAFIWAHPMRTPVKNDLMTVSLDQRTCTAVHSSFVLRHAARYVGLDDMRDFTKVHEKIKYAFENRNYSFVNEWKNSYPEEKASSVTRLGEYEMKYLGTMYGNRLYSLLLSAVSDTGALSEKIMFAATHKTRTQTSAKLFSGWLSKVLTGNNTGAKNVSVRDDVLRFYDSCKAYDEATSDFREVTLFEQGPHFQGVIKNVVERLRLNGTLTVDDIKTLYGLCASELAVNNNPDWCRLLSDVDTDVLQYNSDIEDNISRLYGHPITGQVSCPLATDIFTTLDKVVQGHSSGQNYTVAEFQFGHSHTVVIFFAGLGLYKDNLPLTANNYEQLKNRKFKTAVVSPFSTHIAFILYNCGGSSSKDYAVQLLVNGEPEIIPACNSSVCYYQDVRRAYSHLVEGCHWNNLCSTDHASQGNIVG